MATDAAYSADLERPLVPTAILPRPGAGAFLKENGGPDGISTGKPFAATGGHS